MVGGSVISLLCDFFSLLFTAVGAPALFYCESQVNWKVENAVVSGSCLLPGISEPWYEHGTANKVLMDVDRFLRVWTLWGMACRCALSCKDISRWMTMHIHTTLTLPKKFILGCCTSLKSWSCFIKSDFSGPLKEALKGQIYLMMKYWQWCIRGLQVNWKEVFPREYKNLLRGQSVLMTRMIMLENYVSLFSRGYQKWILQPDGR